MLTMSVMVVTDGLHGWPAPDELLTGVVGWCSAKICGHPCLASSLLHVGMHLGNLGKCGGSLGLPTPTSSFYIHQPELALPLDTFDTHENSQHDPKTIPGARWTCWQQNTVSLGFNWSSRT